MLLHQDITCSYDQPCHVKYVDVHTLWELIYVYMYVYQLHYYVTKTVRQPYVHVTLLP